MQDESDQLLNDSTLRGILLLGGVVAAAYIGYKIYLHQRTIDAANPIGQRIIRVPIELPIRQIAKK